MKNNLIYIINSWQVTPHDHIKFTDDESNMRSYVPHIIFSSDSVKKLYCDMDILLPFEIKDRLEQPDFDPKSDDIEVIEKDGKTTYVQYKYFLKLDDDDKLYRLSKDEYQYLLYKLDFDRMCDFKAKYPTIEELKEYVK